MRGEAALYCVDGTNLVRGSFGYGGEAFRDQEEADSRRLVAILDQVCATLGGKVEVEVFFDGGFRPGLTGSAANLRVRFTGELAADDLILDRVRSASYTGAGRVTVVTGDGELGETARAEGGRWQKVGRGASVEGVARSIEGRFSR